MIGATLILSGHDVQGVMMARGAFVVRGFARTDPAINTTAAATETMRCCPLWTGKCTVKNIRLPIMSKSAA